VFFVENPVEMVESRLFFGNYSLVEYFPFEATPKFAKNKKIRYNKPVESKFRRML